MLPQAALVEGSERNFYGSTAYGGVLDKGTTLDVSTLVAGEYKVWANASFGDLSGTAFVPINLSAPTCSS